ncbi:Spy0128 family protein [Ellagibacter isourolithinifaciens]|uniref:Spy0128 family protein n=1 Tax=Ellagibacter isourolithinifaciens TaxID=2137581 RepID=UPI002E76A3E1|nr:FctA domain-containing protein [Ellagibacter isourolithinifaciens]MEE0044713.1 FctA domain-containing protein [Ellagibacter isourolithinifaciens]
MKRTKIRSILLSALLALTVGMPTLSFADEGASAESGASGAGATPYAAGDKNTVADPNTASTWRNWGLDYSTQSVGRIWTDKTVSTEGIELTGADGTITIKKSPEADFLTAFSALSSTSNLKSTVAQPLDIVLVLDASGSMDDSMGSGDNTKRIDALKAAANSFIDEIAKQNKNISDPAQQHQVSLVKFAGEKSNQVGNNTYYDEDGHKHNRSQVMKNLTSCVGASADDLKSTVNTINPAGTTQADYGLQLAVEQTSGREDAKKIAVFFTDGSPTSSSGFESDVASSAVDAAKSMKDAGATIYSVGIFSGANPSADPANNGTSREDKFMHAVSSNYPTASYTNQGWRLSPNWVWNFGPRATDSDFYKAASNAADLKILFDEISQEITSSTGHPTEVQQGYDPSTSGYITFTDQLGDYMKVDSFTTIVFAKQLFQNQAKSTSGNVDTYTFSGEAGNVLYPSGNLSSIVITVTKSDDLATGDLVEVKIPAALIPLRHFQIDESAGTGSVDLTFPIRVFFESSVKDNVKSALANPDETLAAYIKANTTGNGVAFYANKWSGGEDGDVLAAFTPAKSNSYYYMTEETPIYTDEACTVPAKGALNADGTYYYKRSWYDIGNGQAKPQSGAIQFPGNISESLFGYIGTDASGNAVFKPGTPRITYIDELRTPKDSNPTATATTVLNPLWSGSSVACHLGNNGKLVIEKPGTLAISKSLVVPEGYDRADFANDTFTFTIDIDEAEGQEFPAEVRDVNNEPVGDAFTIAFDNSGQATHSLKDGETLYIRGLSAGWEYLVSEQPTTGFDQIAPAENNDPQAATGTIAAGTQATAEFANAYRPSGTLDNDDALAVKKVLTGRSWTDNDAFRFILTPVTDNAPMPLGENGEPNGVLTLTKQDLADGGYAAGTFGNITYTKPGTYVYEISEDQSVGAGAGMSLSQARYRVVVTVTEELAGQGDDAIHQGILNVSSIMVQIADDDGASVQSDDGVDAATFTNEFAAREAKWNPAVKKEYTDNSGTNPLARGMFNFRIEPVMDNNPMPANPIGAVNADGSVTFEEVTFTGDMIGESFEYRITELVPDGAGNWINVADADSSLLQTGMIYDESTWVVRVDIASKIVDDEPVVVWTASYQLADAAQGSQVESFATFRNTYTPESVNVPAEDFAAGTKTLAGRDMLPNETFGFVLLPGDDATQSAIANGAVRLTSTDAVALRGTNGQAVDFSFGDATFTKPGTYTFMVRENSWNSQRIPADGTQGMAFDRHTATIVVTVTDNNGVLAATRTVENSLDFTNRYTAEGDYAGLVLSKTLNGRDMDQGEFTFHIAGTNDAAAVLLGGDGTRTFVNSEPRAAGVAYEATLLTDLHFTQDDAGKTFTFDVFENVPSIGAPGMTYDKTMHSVAISVASDNAGALVITTTVDGAAGNKVSFTNAYAADPATFDTQAGFGLYKVLEGRDWEANDAFSFLLEPLTMGAPLPGDTIVTVGADMVDPATGHAPISFGDITYNQVGVYKYRVTEINAGYIIGGVKYSSNAAEFTVTVTDLDENGVHTGKLVATAQLTTTPNTREFTNVAGFEYDDNQIPLNAFKRFTNNSAVEMPDMTGLFTFELIAAEANAPMPVATTAHNDADGSVDFGVITFDASLFDNGPIVINSAPVADAANEPSAADKAVASDVPAADAAAVPAAKPAGDGPTTDNPPADANTLVFHYTITEKAGGHADVTNDPNPAFTFEVTVTRDNAGNVTANVTNVQDYVKGTPLRTFTNTYTYTPPVIPDPDPIFAAPVTKKILEGRALVAGEFSFELLENGKVASTGTNDADGNVVFSDIEFTEAGTHIYTMREIGAGTTAAGVTYDATTYQVTADVVEIDNELRVDFAIDGTDGAVFKNAYKAKGTTVIIGATKTLEGRTLAAGEFTFKLTGADGRTYEAKNAADGRIEFPAIDFDKVGTYDFTLVEMNDGQTGITYDDRSYKVTVVVTDDGKGNLVANVTWPNGTPPTFKNTYTKPVPAVTPGTPGKPPVRFAKTGDETMSIACVATLAILAAGAVGAAAFGALRKREKGDERQ